MKTKYKILLCEDDEFLMHLYVYRLQIEGYTVSLIRSGEKVIPHMKAKKPDLVVLDLMLPVKTGFEILEELKQSDDSELTKIPIIIFSNNSDFGVDEKVLALGAKAFVSKMDATPKDLVVKIQEYLRS